MRIIERFERKAKDLDGERQVTIAFIGDSVTHGCFEDIQPSATTMETVYDAENAYHTKVRKIFNLLYPSVPINIINAGINGDKADKGLKRLERDVISYSPDLCVVCFGLNDSCQMVENALEIYKNSLKGIFNSLKEKGIEVIFMTPNMMCTAPSTDVTTPIVNEVSERIANMQNEGRLDMFLDEAKKIAKEMDIPVCDCYHKWKKLYEGGVNINRLVTVNHPVRDMYWMFAYSLVETMFDI